MVNPASPLPLSRRSLPPRTARARLDRWLNGVPPWVVGVFASIWVLLVGVVDLVTGSEIALSILYLGPTAFAAWYASSHQAFAIALMSAVVWYAADRLAGSPPSHVLIPLWNALVRFGFFAVVAMLMREVKTRLDQLEAIATMDALTGVHNARFFRAAAEAELARSRRRPSPMTIAYLDLDAFKTVNDTQGHDVGDRVLAIVGGALLRSVRASDVVARMGGDEFALLLPETGAASAQLAIDRMRLAVLEAMQEHGWPVTVSAGAVTFEAPPRDVRSMLQQADALMYDVKRAGKDGVKYAQVRSPADAPPCDGSGTDSDASQPRARDA